MKAAFLAVFSVLLLCIAACTQAHSHTHAHPFAEAKAKSQALPAPGGTIAHFDFTDPKAWPDKTASATTRGVKASAASAKVGTVDAAGGKEASGGLLLTATRLAGRAGASAEWLSGRLPVACREKNANLLTLSFSLSASSAQPITVSVESFDGAKKRTGGLQTQIFPAAPDFYQRYALDLGTMKPFGAGKFRATDPFVQFRFAAGSASGTLYQLRLDNVNYADPAFYVSPKGSDKNDGRTEATALATPQKSLDLAQPGDIILLMDGTYAGGNASVAAFPRPGAPDAWIVLKNYPGQHPTLTSTGWNIVSIARGSKQTLYEGPALAYLEARGLHVRGEGDVAKQKYPDAMNKADSRTNSNGIAVDGRFAKNAFHHFRFADNLVEFCPGCGIGTIDGDWVQVENNICRSNCWTTIYAPSGISVMGAVNYDAQDNIYKRLVRNNVCCHNQTYEKWEAISKYSDGNGIILDVNQASDAHPNGNYVGRTLVQSNLSYDNGGSGIHTVTANRVDIINNTVYLNSASVHLEYGAIFTYGSQDVHILNNILVARVANVAAGEKPEPVNRLGGKNTDVVFAHNLYFGGNIPPTLGEGDVIGDPLFMNPSIDHTVADFHLRPGSPAIGKGTSTALVPTLDLDGKPRRPKTPAEGAYETGR